MKFSPAFLEAPILDLLACQYDEENRLDNGDYSILLSELNAHSDRRKHPV